MYEFLIAVDAGTNIEKYTYVLDQLPTLATDQLDREIMLYVVWHPGQDPLGPFVQKKRENEVFWTWPGTLTGFATESSCLLGRFCAQNHDSGPFLLNFFTFSKKN